MIKDKIPQSIQDFMEETIITFHDADFNIIRANETAQKILELPPLEETKIKCYKYFHGKDCPIKECPSFKCQLTREPAIFEIFEPHLYRCIEIRAFPRFDRNGEFIGLIHFVRDTTNKRSPSHKCC